MSTDDRTESQEYPPHNNSTAKEIIEQILGPAGIKINGANPWDIQVHNEEFYERVLADTGLGLGESYMDQWWDCDQLDVLFDKLLSAEIGSKVKIPLHEKLHILWGKFLNLQKKKDSKEVIDKHYNLGNDLYKVMLDQRMNYSCGYWKNANTLDEAQEAKLDLICQKLQLQPGMSLLDIGCGWGGLVRFAAEKYGVHAKGVTLSEEQYDYAKEYCKGFDVDVQLQDYRDLDEKFDRVVSVGMFEHVGHKNYRQYMEIVHRCLDDHSLFLLQTIGNNETAYATNVWIDKYIFPNGVLPSIAQLGKSIEKLFVMEDWQNFGPYYDQTLMAWHQNFTRNWESIKADYDQRFYRMWVYYLLSSAGNFRARAIELWQVVLSRKGLRTVYISPR